MNLKAMREDKGMSRRAVAKVVSVQVTEYGQLEAGKKSPRRNNGEWRGAVLKLARFFRCPPEDLFPEAPKEEPEFASVDVEGIPDGIGPEDIAAGVELAKKLEMVLSTLSKKEELVLRMRFGLGVPEQHTLAEIGTEMGLTRERIRQIEAKALRRLRHPSRSKRMSAIVEKS